MCTQEKTHYTKGGDKITDEMSKAGERSGADMQ